MKKCVMAFIMICIALPPIATSAADGQRATPRYTDVVGLLTAQQISELTARLDEISNRRRFDLVITVTDTTGAKSPRLYAADFFEEQGFGFGEDLDGIILMLAMQERDFAFVTTGYGLYAFTDAGQAHLESLFLPHLREDNYFEAFMAFAGGVDDFLEQAAAGTPYTAENIPAMTAEERRNAHITAAVVSVLLALGISFAVVMMWTGQLKTVKPRDHAADYVIRNSLVLTVQRDIFLYRNVSRVPRNTGGSGGGGMSGGFSSSSGRSFSGRSGKF